MHSKIKWTIKDCTEHNAKVNRNNTYKAKTLKNRAEQREGWNDTTKIAGVIALRAEKIETGTGI